MEYEAAIDCSSVPASTQAGKKTQLDALIYFFFYKLGDVSPLSDEVKSRQKGEISAQK